MLPVREYLDPITKTLLDRDRLVLVAPPGTGKSTLVPAHLMSLGHRVTVLQPRRVAARMLASRAAEGRTLGDEVGYAVRHDRKAGPRTRLLFATAGVYLQELLQSERQTQPDILVLDEWHERTVENDLAAAWALSRPHGPRLLVMSATIEADEVARWMGGAPVIEVPGTAHPVSMRHQSPMARESLGDQVARAFRDLRAEGLDGSVLVFLPGKGEIERVAEILGPAVRDAGIKLLRLHGAMPLELQREALEVPSRERSVILATNVAETSLTIPGVTAVIDCGKARRTMPGAPGQPAALRLGWITRANAIQRAGRAGRTAPGRCIRLWSPEFTASMDERPHPAILVENPLQTVLRLRQLGIREELPTPLPEAVVQQATARLRALGATDASGALTDQGKKMAQLPLDPEGAAVVASAVRDDSPWTWLLAATAVLRHEPGHPGGDLLQDAWELLRAPSRFGDSARTLRQIGRICGLHHAESGPWENSAVPGDEARRAVAIAWLEALPDALAARAERAHRDAADERVLLPEGSPDLVLLLHRQPMDGTGQRVTRCDAWLEAKASWWPEALETAVVTGWDERHGRVVQQRAVRLVGLLLRHEPLPPSAWQPSEVQQALAEAIMNRGLRLAALEDADLVQWLRRVRLAARLLPDEGWPDLDEDWPLILHEACAGLRRPEDLDPGALRRVIDELLGPWLAQRLQRLAPARWPLPNGRHGRITIDEDGKAELSARLGDLIGLTGPQRIFEGRLPLRFDILAPNMRTVQKTDDLDRFWHTAYPEIKRELKRRYPRHPWP
ncbi:MAG: ATP-dependent helicase C-terminal domain-containing protein [Candidatus Sericytochromatia bacterium]|nr:ATP-dependent helicase C-terminal domain-containing protein [Candidatus Sericytochromatia bacterium]